MSATVKLRIRAIASGDADAVIELWQACGLTRPWNDPAADIERKLADSAESFLVGEHEGRIVATIMAGYDGHRGWLNYLGVEPSMRGRGFGRAMVQAAEARLATLGCAKINLQIRDDNTAARGFYAAIGYVHDPVVSYGKRLTLDD